MYEWLLFIHVTAAVIWVGGAAVSQVYAIRAQASGDPQRIAQLAKDIEWVGSRIFSTASLVLLIAGVWLVLEMDLEFTQFWIWFALLAYAISFVTGVAFLGPESGRLGKLIAEHGPAHPEVEQRLARIFLISRLELVLLFVVVADMTFKPGL